MTIGVKYIGYPNSSGYGLATFAYVRALHNAGIPVWWQPWFLRRKPRLWTPKDGLPTLPLAQSAGGAAKLGDLRALVDACMRPIEYDTVVCHTVPVDFARFVEPGKRMLGYTVWETDALPPHWPPLLEAMDALAVPSRMNAEVFGRSGISRPVHVVPHICRQTWSDSARDKAPALRRRLGIPDDHFVFYSIGAWDPRKAMEDLMVTFAETFTAEQRVTLLIKTTSRIGGDPRHTGPVEPRVHEVAETTARRLGRPKANVVVMPAADISGATIDAIHAIGDCYVSFTHGEGWGMGAFDAAALAKPVLITDWGGQLDYLGPGYPGLIRSRMTPVTGWLPHDSYQANGRWAQADVEHASALMRAAVARDPALFDAAARLRETVTRRFAEPVVARQLLAVIDERATS
jgi:glycosyltransferase involved in cell wall biosynthesis